MLKKLLLLCFVLKVTFFNKKDLPVISVILEHTLFCCMQVML